MDIKHTTGLDFDLTDIGIDEVTATIDERQRHFEQVRASLALEGLILETDALAVMNRVIAGTTSYDNAALDMTRLSARV